MGGYSGTMASPPRKRRKGTDFATLVATYTCPITQSLLVDPVTAADGACYEREAIERWLQDKSTSPTTNKELPHKLLFPANTVRTAITDLLDGDVESDKQAAAAWHVATGRMKQTGALPGGPSTAMEHFVKAKKLGSAESEVIVTALEAKVAAEKMSVDLSFLFCPIHLTATIPREEPCGDWEPLDEWDDGLEFGTIVKLTNLDDLRQQTVDWTDDMCEFAGQKGVVTSSNEEERTVQIILLDEWDDLSPGERQNAKKKQGSWDCYDSSDNLVSFHFPLSTILLPHCDGEPVFYQRRNVRYVPESRDSE